MRAIPKANGELSDSAEETSSIGEISVEYSPALCKLLASEGSTMTAGGDSFRRLGFRLNIFKVLLRIADSLFLVLPVLDFLHSGC